MRDYKTAVVIPCYKTWELCRSLVINLSRYERDNIDEIVVVNDDPAMTGELSREILSDYKIPVRILRNDINIGFTLSSNLGISAAFGRPAEQKIIFLISTDVKIGAKFVEDTADILLGAKRHLVGNRYIGWNTGWNTFDGEIFPYLEGWFLAATSDGWRDLGLFDPSYSPYDMEDIDLATTAIRKGYKLTSLNNPGVVHMGGGTIGFNPEREAITKRNKRYFQKKWMPE